MADGKEEREEQKRRREEEKRKDHEDRIDTWHHDDGRPERQES